MRKILAVDDDKDILDVLQFILEDSGYEVETLSDGHFLFEKIKANAPDLILQPAKRSCATAVYDIA